MARGECNSFPRVCRVRRENYKRKENACSLSVRVVRNGKRSDSHADSGGNQIHRKVRCVGILTLGKRPESRSAVVVEKVDTVVVRSRVDR